MLSHDKIVVNRQLLTLDFERVPPSASIQTYSAMIDPFWGRLMYLAS